MILLEEILSLESEERPKSNEPLVYIDWLLS